MGLAYPEIKSFRGIYKQANSFSIPDGALEQAENCVLQRDGVISNVRGTYLFNDPTATAKTLNNFGLFQNKLIGIYTALIGYFSESGSAPNKVGTINAAGGSAVAVTDRTSRTAEASKNFYFTTTDGVKLLEAYNGNVRMAGIPPALDIRAKFIAQNGQIAAETQVAWRVEFGRRDANDNLKTGAPSDIVVLTNSKIVGATWVRAANVVTVTTTSPHGLATNMSITTSNCLGSAAPIVDGAYTVTSTPTATTFTFASTAADDASGNTVDYTATRAARLEISIPTELESGLEYFARVHRSSQTASSSASPDPDFKLVAEYELSSTDIDRGFFQFDDDVDDILLGAELYTNPNSREGETQANHRPPLCKDLALFKNHLIYLNCVTRHLLELGTVDTSALSDGDYFEIRVGAIDRRYIAKDGVSNQLVTASAVSGTGTIQITYTAHGFSNADVVYVSNITGTLTAGYYVVSNVAADTFEITAAGLTATALDFQGVIDQSATVTGAAWVRASNVVTVTQAAHGLQTGAKISVSNSSGGTPEVDAGVYTVTRLTASTFTFAHTGTDDASGNTLDYDHALMFHLDNTSTSPAAQLRNTAQGLVKAINRDDSALVYANYTSSITGVPGLFRLLAKGFTDTIYVRANDAGAAGAFSPTLPSSFSSGTQVYSRNDQNLSRLYAAKVGQPEAVPLVNDFPAGAENAELLRGVALRDSLILIKQDGVYRMSGDSVSNFTITPLDTTCICLVPDTVKVINNQVYMLSNQGVAKITDSSVEIISRDIEDDIQPILGATDLDTYTTAVAYEGDRLYMLSTKAPNQDGTYVTHILNVLNNGWTTRTDTIEQGLVGPEDRLYLLKTDGKIYRERKDQTKIDYCGQNYTVTVTSVAASGLSAVISSTTEPVEGWVIVKSELFSRIATVTETAANTYTVTFYNETNLAALDTPTMYAKYRSTIKLAPFHAGLIGRMKHYSQLAAHFRDSAVSRLAISFASTYFSSSEAAPWIAEEAVEEGWGSGPWGFFPWGNVNSIDLTFGTQKATPARVFVPPEGARATFIQPVIEHEQAGEPLNLQALSFTVRPYGERVAS